MNKGMWSAQSARGIIKRIVIECDLVLETPAHFGNGDTDDLVDMPVLIDEVENCPLLTGTSIAGAMKSYLRDREYGFGEEEKSNSLCTKLFGSSKKDDLGYQSRLIIDDAFGRNFALEMRHGVRIEGDSRTAADKALYDLHLWSAGTIFPLRFELSICKKDKEQELKEALASALCGLKNGEITLGARKRRGYGQISTSNWRMKTFEINDENDLLAWIISGGEELTNKDSVQDIINALGVLEEVLPDKRDLFSITASFKLASSMIIRSEGNSANEPDAVSLSARSPKTGDMQPIMPGTSLGGALRARATQIVNLLGADPDIVESIFGIDATRHGEAYASRLTVSENLISNANFSLVQNRIKIDRFTGGVMHGALFNEQPVFSGDTEIKLQMRNPKDAEIGLLLLLLKDLWTEDLPIGGESSIGRGRLQGLHARLLCTKKNWDINLSGNSFALPESIMKEMQKCVNALAKPEVRS